MSPLERLLDTAASALDPVAVLQVLLQQQQQQGDGMQALLGLAGEALRRAGGLDGLLGLLLSQDVQGCCADLPEGQSAKARGNACFKQRRFEEAARHYTEALRLVDETTAPGAPLAAALYCNRALCFLRLSPPQATWAVQDASCAIACHPTSSKAWYRRACARQAAGDVAGALGDVQRALELQPKRQQQEQQGASSEIDSLVGALQQQLGMHGKEGPGSGQQVTGANGQVSQGGAELPQAAGPAINVEREGSLGLGMAQPSDLPTAAAPGAASPSAVPAAEQGASCASGSDTAHSNGRGEVTSGPPPPAPATAEAAVLAMQRSCGALTVGWSEAGGRFLVARRDLPGGADVLRESPFVLALTRAGRETCCHHCGRELAARHPATGTAPQQPPRGPEAVPPLWYCRACPLARYCSPACREAGEAPHCHLPGGPECGRPWAALLPPEALLALRLARRLREEGPASEVHQLMASLEAHFGQLAPAEAARLALLALVVHATWQGAQAQAAAVLGQVGGSAAAASAVTARVAKGVQSSPGRAPPLSAQEVLRALCQVRVNGIAVVPAARAGAADRLGLALYPAASMMNHACCPSVSIHFQGATAVLRTLGPLPAGAPLLHCYGPQQGEMSWWQRQHLLQSQYCFACSCTACAGGPSAADVELVGLRCPRCDCSSASVPPARRGSAGGSYGSGAVLPPVGVLAGLLSCQELPPPTAGGYGSRGCSACGAAMGPTEWHGSLLPRLLGAAEHAAHAEKLVTAAEGGGGRGCEAEEAVQLLGMCLEERQRLLHPCNQLLGSTHDALARALHATGRPTAAATHLRASLDLLTRHYPAASTAVAFQQLQLAAMLWLAAGGEEGAGAGAGARCGAGGPLLVSQTLGGGSSRAREAMAEADELECAALEVLVLHFGPEAAASLVER